MMWEEKVKRTEMSLFQEEFVRRGLRLVHDALFGCLLGRVRTTERGAANANERETGDLVLSAVSLRYTTRELEGDGGRAGTGTRIEDDVEALGARKPRSRKGGSR